ncbi:hybrid signal transduction histidine kinase I-like [Littorina saxatilis]|uniref:Uncharacterized protein n=1 Tax=Littorina saxatilis TaxID=31220 RepID=A0AAN9BPS5_9CAEN
MAQAANEAGVVVGTGPEERALSVRQDAVTTHNANCTDNTSLRGKRSGVGLQSVAKGSSVSDVVSVPKPALTKPHFTKTNGRDGPSSSTKSTLQENGAQSNSTACLETNHAVTKPRYSKTHSQGGQLLSKKNTQGENGPLLNSTACSKTKDDPQYQRNSVVASKPETKNVSQHHSKSLDKNKPEAKNGSQHHSKSLDNNKPETENEVQHQRNGLDTSKPELNAIHSLLAGVELIPVDASSDNSNTESSDITDISLFSVPMTTDMAEAIKRQQKGGSVRYWKAKQLLSNGGHPLSIRPNGGVLPHSVFPHLKPLASDSNGKNGGGEGGGGRAGRDRGGGGGGDAGKGVEGDTEKGGGGGGGGGGGQSTGATTNGVGTFNADRKHNRARERMLRQRSKENATTERQRGSSNSTNSHYNIKNTHFVFGSSLGYPPPPAGYKRSVTSLESLLSMPLPPSSSSLTPNSHTKLTTNGFHPNSQSCDSSLQQKLTQNSNPEPYSYSPQKLTHPPSHNSTPHRLGQLNLAAASSDNGQLRETRQTDTDEHGDHDNNNCNNSNTMVADLTCMQLADTILATRTSDLSRIYEICQTKIRYVDFLERSAMRNGGASSQSPLTSPRDSNDQKIKLTTKLPKPALPDSLRLTQVARRNNWVPSSDSISDPQNSDTSPRTDNGGEGGREERGEGRIRTNPPVTLPSLAPSPGNGLTLTRGLTLSHGIPPTASRTYLVSPLHDTDVTASSPAALCTAGPPGKPILKPYNPITPMKPNNQEASIVNFKHHPSPYLYPHHNHRHNHDPFAPSFPPPPPQPPINGGLSVRGTTMYPFMTEPGGGHSDRMTRRSRSRSEADMRNRAVRFSINDQVFEFAPGEPLIQ